MLSVFNLKSVKYGRELNHSSYLQTNLDINESLPPILKYNKSIGNINILNQSEITNILKFKRVHSEKYIKDIKNVKYYTQGNTSKDTRNDCHIRYNPYKCGSQKDWGSTGHNDRAKYKIVKIYANIIHSFNFSGNKIEGYNNIFYGKFDQNATKDERSYGSYSSGNLYAVVFKDNNFESKDNYAKKYHNRFLIFFYNSKENAINKINPVDFFEMYHQHTKYPPASKWLFLTIFIVIIMILLGTRAFAMLKYGCEKNWLEFFFGRCGSIIRSRR